MIRYNVLAKVSAVETFRNELGGFKVGREGRFVSVPDEVPGTGNHSAGERIGRYSAVKLVDDGGAHVFVFQKVQVDEYFGGRRLTSQDRLGSVGSYYPYGEAKSGTVSNADSFATYYRDSTGLDLSGERYLAVYAGRFISSDPSDDATDLTNPGSFNSYRYTLADPVNQIDPSGRAEIAVPSGGWPVFSFPDLNYYNSWTFNVNLTFPSPSPFFLPAFFFPPAPASPSVSTSTTLFAAGTSFGYVNSAQGATALLRMAVLNLSAGCRSVLNFSSLSIAVSQTTILDHRGPGDRPVISFIPGTQNSMQMVSNYCPKRDGACVMRQLNGNLYRMVGNQRQSVIVLQDFWGGEARPTGNWQASVLIHELFHIAYNLTDAPLAARFGIRIPNGSNASQAIQAWLDRECHN